MVTFVLKYLFFFEFSDFKEHDALGRFCALFASNALIAMTQLVLQDDIDLDICDLYHPTSLPKCVV